MALRAGISVLVPLLALTDRLAWAAYATFGAFTSLYGRRSQHAERTGMQAVAGLSLVISVVLGVCISLAPGSRWLVVGVVALVAAGGSFLSDAFGWHPPGPLFLVFGVAVSAAIPAHPSNIAIAACVATASAAFVVLIGQVGALRVPQAWRAPNLPVPRFAQVWSQPGTRAHLLRYVVSVALAGSLATAFGGSHPYWAMVSAVVPLAGPDLTSRLTRGLQRVVGTLLGLLIAAGVLSLQAQGVWAVLAIVLLQMTAELLVGRNYALALLFITPLALQMGQLVHPMPVGTLLADRLLETLLGAAVGAGTLLLIPDRFTRRRH